MLYDLSIINYRIKTTPMEYVLESEKYFNSRIRKAADEIFNNIDQSPIVLLSGPSGSGKTTTSLKLANELRRLGISVDNISLDNYFQTVDPLTAPRTPNGDIDYESPACLDMPLLNAHFRMLTAGEEIQIPHFSFTRQQRSPDKSTPMKLSRNEIAIFEGIHALNESITREHPAAFRVYVSTLTNIEEKGAVLIDSNGMRLIRRIVRDDYFRGADPQFTLKLWENVRRGEVLNILPYKDSANFTIDSALPYEISVMKQFTGDIFSKVPKDSVHYTVLSQVLDAFDRFETINPGFVPPDSILREFIGGSVFEY